MKLEALVEAAVFIGRADGQFSEAELEVFIDHIRVIVGEPVSASELINLARRARTSLRALGREAYLQQLRVKLRGVPKAEVEALAHAIAHAEGLKPVEQAAIDDLLA